MVKLDNIYEKMIAQVTNWKHVHHKHVDVTGGGGGAEREEREGGRSEGELQICSDCKRARHSAHGEQQLYEEEFVELSKRST